MTEDRLPLAELLAKSGDGDFLRCVAEAELQMLMEADAVTARLEKVSQLEPPSYHHRHHLAWVFGETI